MSFLSNCQVAMCDRVHGVSKFPLDSERRYRIERREADRDICDIGEELGQMETEVKIVFPMSHNDKRPGDVP
jgi:hypothetical protein